MQRKRTDRSRFIPGGIALFFILHALFYVWALGWDAVDDAYISFRYAQNAILGNGLVFNAGERVEGFTNFLWTALMIPIQGVGLDVGRSSMILGVLFGIGLLWLATRVAAALQVPRVVGWLAALLLAADGSLAIWSVSGLETAMFAFLIGGGILFYLLEQHDANHYSERAARHSERSEESGPWMPVPGLADLAHDSHNNEFRQPEIPRFARNDAPPARNDAPPARNDAPPARNVDPGSTLRGLFFRGISNIRFPVSAVSFALAAMTRPEAAAVFALTVAHQAAARLVRERRLFTLGDVLRGIVFSALFIPYWLVRWRYYHSFFPNSFYAKVAPGGPAAQLARGWHYLDQFVGVHGGWIILVPALVALGVAVWGASRHSSGRHSERATRHSERSEETLAGEIGYYANHEQGQPAPGPASTVQIPRFARNDALPARNDDPPSARNDDPPPARSDVSTFGGANSLFGFSYLALVVLFYSLYITYVGGDWSVGRFFVPLLLPAYLLIALGLFEVFSWIKDVMSSERSEQSSAAQSRHQPPAAARPRLISRSTRNDKGSSPWYAAGVALALILALGLAWTSSWNGEYGIFVRGFDAARATEAREAMGQWLSHNVPPGTWIAVDAAGQVPYFSKLPAIDMFGINDLHIGRLAVPTLGEGTPGHEKFDLAYIIQRRPRYVIIYGTLFDTVTEYRRIDAPWTTDAELKKFLTIYESR